LSDIAASRRKAGIINAPGTYTDCIQVPSGTGSPSMVRVNLQADNAAGTASSQPTEPLLRRLLALTPEAA